MEITNVALIGATPALENAGTPLRTEGLSEASMRFNALMEAPETGAAGHAAFGPGDVFAPPPQQAGGTLGEAILGSMRQVSEDFSVRWSQVHDMMQQEVTSMQDLLKMQLSLTQASVQYEVVGKAISKSTQNFDQLVRLQ